MTDDKLASGDRGGVFVSEPGVPRLKPRERGWGGSAAPVPSTEHLEVEPVGPRKAGEYVSPPSKHDPSFKVDI